jgi:heptosyltransferase-1
MQKAGGPETIAVIRLSSLGDIIHTLPSLQLIRQRYPGARISWIVESAGAGLLENFAGIDDIIVLDLKNGGLFNRVKALKKFVREYRGKFDLIIDFQGLLKSAFLSYLLKGHAIGFGKRNLKEPLSRFFYSERAGFFDENRHVIYKNMHLLSLLNIQNGRIHYPLNPLQMPKALEGFMKEHRLEEGKFIVVNVGGGWQSKILEESQYIDIIKPLKDKHKIVILWGNDREKATAQGVAQATGAVISRFLEFDELIALIRQASLVITADTLALHVADMVCTPSVGIFGPTLPERNGSLLKQSKAVFERIPCSFCYKKKCDTIACMKSININKIVTSAESIYEKYN